ncbi:hypothetical protein [Bradyrhizobium guangzhouense]|uniref:hypothetical protein n=1 Tax=Bradyrhizobium guangzhouense TaxID=1325095 RepID=UPI001009F327|nr:hypothetical protein [Bradyrhizobium guangzhouense]
MTRSAIEVPAAERSTAARGARLIAFVLFAVLSYSFCTNGFSIVPDILYRSHGADPESLVVGRLIESESNGLTGNTGFLIHRGYSETYRDFRTGQRPIAMTQTYTGQVGLQGWILSAIDLPMYKAGIAAPVRLVLLRSLAAMALAAILCIWVYLIALEFGAGAGLTAGFMILYSPWLTVFADNLYWVPCTWFLPVVLAWYWTIYRPDLFAASPMRFYLLHGIAVVAKALCGFEYIPAVLGASGAAFLYGISRSGWNRRTLVRLVAFGAAAVAAILVAVAVQLLMLALHTGSLANAITDFVERINYRAVGDGQLPPELAASLAVPLGKILATYLHDSPALNIPGLRTYTALEALVTWSVALAVAMLYMDARDRSIRRTLAPFLLVVISVVASFSWHVVARGHSYVHTFLNYVLWFVPALIVVPAVAVGMFSKAFLNPGMAPLRAIVAVLFLGLSWTIYWTDAARHAAFASGLVKRSNMVAGQRMTLRFTDSAIDGTFNCDSFDLTRPFFMRLDANPKSGETTSQPGGVVQKFTFRSNATSTELNELRYGQCAFRFQNGTLVPHVVVGQFSDDSGLEVAWEEGFWRPAAH